MPTIHKRGLWVPNLPGNVSYFPTTTLWVCLSLSYTDASQQFLGAPLESWILRSSFRDLFSVDSHHSLGCDLLTLCRSYFPSCRFSPQSSLDSSPGFLGRRQSAHPGAGSSGNGLVAVQLQDDIFGWLWGCHTAVFVTYPSVDGTIPRGMQQYRSQRNSAPASISNRGFPRSGSRPAQQ